MSKYRPASLLVLSCIFGVALAACDGELPFSSEAMSGFSIHTKLLIAKNDDTSVDKNEFALSAFPAFRNKLQDFSFRLTDSFFAHHFNAGRENIAFSPLSTYMALAMLAECSASDTRQEVLDAFGMTYDEVLTQTDLLYRYSTKEFRSEVDNEIAAQQTLANSLWFDRSFPLKQSGLETLSDSYYCDSFETNFAHSPRASGQDFSYYVKEQTKGLIDKEYSFDSTTSFILSNVLYLKVSLC